MQTPRHIVLAGDSIFDNDSYVMGDFSVIQQMRMSIPKGWSASKVAIDGARMAGVPQQIANLPTHATDLIVSVGGNDALQYAYLLDEVRLADQLDRLLKEPVGGFAAHYANMLDAIRSAPVRLSVCTIYTDIPFPEPNWRLLAPSAIAAFNRAIIEQAMRRDIPILRLEHVCTEANDFSIVSEIEPSAKGGQKIVDAIIEFLKRQTGEVECSNT